MKPIDIIVIVIIALMIGGVSAYIIRAKKKGQKCIGCPYSSSCSSKADEGGCGGSCEHCSSCGGERK